MTQKNVNLQNFIQYNNYSYFNDWKKAPNFLQT
jgi:hypothetical protein